VTAAPAIKGLENVRHLQAVNAHTAILNGDPDFLAAALFGIVDESVDTDPAAFPTVLHGIYDQVLQALRERGQNHPLRGQPGFDAPLNYKAYFPAPIPQYCPARHR